MNCYIPLPLANDISFNCTDQWAVKYNWVTNSYYLWMIGEDYHYPNKALQTKQMCMVAALKSVGCHAYCTEANLVCSQSSRNASIIPLTANYAWAGNTIKSCQHHCHCRRHYWASDSLSFTSTLSIFRVRFKVSLHHICGTLVFLNVIFLYARFKSNTPQQNSPVVY